MEKAKPDLAARLNELKRRLQETTDPAVATVISDDIADLEIRLRAIEAADGPDSGQTTDTA
jgi:hypothetical protein